MELPAKLREAISALLEGVSRTTLAERAARMSGQYRAGGTTACAVRDRSDALAYLVSRLPATYAAVRQVFSRLQERCPAFIPQSILDLGSGPGTASWAAVDTWPRIEAVTQIDRNDSLLQLGAAIADLAGREVLRNARRIPEDIVQEPASGLSAELVIISYTLAELRRDEISNLLQSLWPRCMGALVVVEPGTPSGYARVLDARKLLLDHSARILAPCPHQLPCPLAPPDWCHFVQRLSRSRDQLMLKSAALSYEDEKFSYLVAVREELFTAAKKSRVLAKPEVGKAAVVAKLCKADGSYGFISIARRDREAYNQAKKKTWGGEL